MALAEQAERAEQALEAARIGVEQGAHLISGTVCLTCTDSVLQGLLVPALARFMPAYPALTLELSTSNDFANLSRRDADIALRLTNSPPEHLVGRPQGAALPGCDTALWLLTRPDCRALRSVVGLFDELAQHLRLP